MHIVSPNIPSVLLESREVNAAVAAALSDEDDVRGMHFCHGVWQDGQAPAPLEFRGCVFDNFRLSRCSLQHVRFTDVIFRRCDMSNTDLTGCRMQRCAFLDCKAVGLLLAEAVLRQLTLTRCHLQFSNFSGCTCAETAFEACDLSGSVLADSRLTKITLKDCQLLQVNLCGSPLKGIDLTSCQIEGWSLSGGELEGAIVTPYQAAELAKFLGLVVRTT